MTIGAGTVPGPVRPSCHCRHRVAVTRTRRSESRRGRQRGVSANPVLACCRRERACSRPLAPAPGWAVVRLVSCRAASTRRRVSCAVLVHASIASRLTLGGAGTRSRVQALAGTRGAAADRQGLSESAGSRACGEAVTHIRRSESPVTRKWAKRGGGTLPQLPSPTHTYPLPRPSPESPTFSHVIRV